MENRSVVLIPARFASSRFPGKPLVELAGKPMIIWVAELCAQAMGTENVYVATDDERIEKVVTESGYSVVMTGPALTGTDRLAEAAMQINAHTFINVQGDEPLVAPEDIVKIAKIKQQNPHAIINGFSFLSEGENPHNKNIPKVISNENDDLVYMSRCALPGFKDSQNAPDSFKKQVCIYAFTKEQLRKFRDFGRKSELERSEDIEILRFLELGIPIKMVKTQPGSLAVDTPEDVALVESELRALHNI